MDNGDTFEFFLPSERRSGIDRRQFSYDVYIPERRGGKDRRDGEKPLGMGSSSDHKKKTAVIRKRFRMKAFFDPDR